MSDYVVTAGYVTVETAVPGGGRAKVDILRGAVLPGDVSAEDIQRELARGGVAPLTEDDARPRKSVKAAKAAR